MHFAKFFFINLLLITLFSLKVTTFATDGFSKVTFEKVLETAGDENELEKELEADKFQEINQKKLPCISFHNTQKNPSFKKPIFIKILPVKFKTPPPEILS